MVLRVLVVAALLWSLRMHWLICYSFFIWFGVIRNYILLSSWGWGGSCHPILIQPFLINLLMCLYVIFDVPDYFSSNGIENRGCLIWGTTYIHACAVLLGRAQSSFFFSACVSTVRQSKLSLLSWISATLFASVWCLHIINHKCSNCSSAMTCGKDYTEREGKIFFWYCR